MSATCDLIRDSLMGRSILQDANPLAQRNLGITVTHAPESTVISVSVHSSGPLIVLIAGRFICCNMLSPLAGCG